MPPARLTNLPDWRYLLLLREAGRSSTAPGSLILPPGLEHRTTTDETAPCRLADLWIGPEEKRNAPGMNT